MRGEEDDDEDKHKFQDRHATRATARHSEPVSRFSPSSRKRVLALDYCPFSLAPHCLSSVNEERLFWVSGGKIQSRPRKCFMRTENLGCLVFGVSLVSES